MNAVFTIVAKNYLALARTLGDSLKKLHPELDFYIFLSDETEGKINLNEEKHKTIEVKDLEIDNWKNMAFKYDVVEFSTSVKPFIFNHLFTTKKYEKILYIDPDIYVFNPLDEIFNILEENFIVITPHINNMQVEFKGALSEESILVSGTYNLGFVGLSNSPNGLQIVKWWMNRLSTMCYTDKMDGLFYDQRWIDLIPGYFETGVKIYKNYGCNVAWWNMHERQLITENGKYFIENKENNLKKYPLIFFHFSGYDVLNPSIINRRFKKNPKFVLETNKEFEKIFMDYSKEAVDNGHKELCKMKYKYNYFDNGQEINKFARRIFRKVVELPKDYSYEDSFRRKLHKKIYEKNYIFQDPFKSDEGSFYKILKKDKLLAKNSQIDKVNLDNENIGLEKKIRILVFFMKILKHLLGIKNYLMLIKFLERYSKEEYQIFLLSELNK